MPASKLSEDDFITNFRRYGADGVSEKFGIALRAVYRRRRSIEERRGIFLDTPTAQLQEREASHKARRSLKVKDGIVLTISDQHYWPGIVSTAHAAFVEFCAKYKGDLKAVVWNGDAFDGAKVGRHARIAWEYQPEPADELQAVKERSAEVERAVGKTPLYWMLGNHDARFETYFAAHAPAMEWVHGVHLKDHLPAWNTGWSLFVNDDTVFKHRWKGGKHAEFNNTVESGTNIITGHLHRLKIYAYTDYKGDRYGVGLPTGAEPNGPQFMDYTEDNPKNWQSGFMVLTFKDGKLMFPEPVLVRETGVVEFRGDRIKV